MYGSEELLCKVLWCWLKFIVLCIRVNQSKVRRDGDPWHDVAIPLKSDDS